MERTDVSVGEFVKLRCTKKCELVWYIRSSHTTKHTKHVKEGEILKGEISMNLVNKKITLNYYYSCCDNIVEIKPECFEKVE